MDQKIPTLLARSGRLATAVRALAPQCHLVARHREVGTLRELENRRLQLVVFERDDAAALLADDVMVVMAPWVDPLVASGVTADVNPLDQPQPVELIERSVDGRAADVRQLPVDLERGQGAALVPEDLHDLPPAAATPEARLRQGAQRPLAPGARGALHPVTFIAGTSRFLSESTSAMPIATR